MKYAVMVDNMFIKEVDTYKEGYDSALIIEKGIKSYYENNIVDARSIFSKFNKDSKIEVVPIGGKN